MATFLLGFSVFVFAMLGMSVGVLCGRRPLKEGGCGNLEDDGGCGHCLGGDAASKERRGA